MNIQFGYVFYELLLGKHGEYLMSEVSKFLIEEYDNTNHKINEINYSIRGLDIDIDSIDNYLKKIRQKESEPESLFESKNYDTCFREDEIQKLESQRQELLSKKSLLQDELSELTFRCERIKKLCDDCNNDVIASEIYNNNSKVYSHTVSMNELSNQEKDRRRIAMDIHDTVVQDLAAIIFKNEFILHIMQSDIERARIEIKNNSDMLNNCISELRNIIFNLRPLPLENSNFKDSFCKMVDLLQKKTNMLIQYEYKGDECPDIDKVLLINVIRMIFELCTNSIKYSRGTNIYISIEITKKNIKFFVADNGCGFDYNNVCKNTKGQGLSMIRDRLYIFNGSVKVTKNNDKGIKFYIDIPLKYKEK